MPGSGSRTLCDELIRRFIFFLLASTEESSDAISCQSFYIQLELEQSCYDIPSAKQTFLLVHVMTDAAELSIYHFCFCR